MNLRFIAVSAVLFLCPGIALAQAPIQLRGGGMQGQRTNTTWKIGPDGIAHFAALDPDTGIGGQKLADIMTQVNAAVTSAKNAVTKDTINAPGGVAGLDANGAVTADLRPQIASLGADIFGSYLTNNFVGGFDPQRGYEADLIGGWNRYADGSYMTRQVLQQTDPYGPYSAGCGYAINVGATYTQQSPMSEGNPPGGAGAVVGVGGFDTAAHCILAGNTPARMVLPVSGYTATTVQLSAPLTASQAARIHPNMYITTNSPNTALTVSNTAGELPKKNLYAAYVRTAPATGDTSITVWAWDVPGLGTGVAGQVPQTVTLDTVWSKYSVPVVFLGGGAAGSMFGSNWFFSLQAADLTPSATTQSLIHQITPLELDGPFIQGGTAPNNSVDWQGISMNAGNQPAALTTDSRQFLIGGNINHHIQFDGGAGNWLIDGDNAYLPSLKNQSLSSGNPAQLYQEWDQWIGGANRIRFLLWNSFSNPAAPIGWEQAVVHLGPTVDGDPVQQGDPGGSKQADLEWNVGGNYGSISLCGFAASCGLRVNGDGTVNISGAVSAGAINSSSLTSTGAVSGKSLTATTDVSGASANISGQTTTGTLVTNGDTVLMSGAKLWIRPVTLNNGLMGAWCAPDSYTLATCSNIGASITLRVSGDLQSSNGSNDPFWGANGNLSGFHPDGHGNWSTTTDTTNGGAFRDAAYTLASLPTANETDGNHLWCSDCKLNSITGVEVYWHASAAKWTDGQNNALAN